MRCNNCGAENRDDAKYCRACGARLNSGSVSRSAVRLRRGLLVAGILLACVFSVGLAITVRKGKGDVVDTPSTTIDIEATLQSMREANGGELPEIYYDPADANSPRCITGRFTDRRITDAREAIASLSDVAALYGIANPVEEFRLAREISQFGTTIYRLQQRYRGIEVFGRELIVCADEDSYATSLSGTYSSGIDIREAAPTGTPSGMEMVVWIGDDHEAEYAWKSSASAFTRVYSQDFSKVLHESDQIDTAVKTIPLIQDGLTIDVDVQDGEDGRLELFDTSRNLAVFDAGGRELTAERLVKDNKVLAGTLGFRYYWYGGKPFKGKKFSESDLTESAEDGTYSLTIKSKTVSGLRLEDLIHGVNWEGIWLDDSWEDITSHMSVSATGWQNNTREENGVRALAYTTEAYDYYQSLDGGWHGYDGENGIFRIVVNNAMGGQENAWSWDNLITVSGAGGVERDTIAHEYTHSVMGYRCGDISGGSEGYALKEAYADIMACAITNSRTWDLGGRNLADPYKSKADEDKESDDGSCQHPSLYKGPYWIDLEADEELSGENDRGWRHQNSTVIGHAAYLMFKKGLSTRDVGKIWFASMPYLDTYADFLTCRCAVLAAARSLAYDDEAIEIITSAFDEVGVRTMAFTAVTEDSEVHALDTSGEELQRYYVRLIDPQLEGSDKTVFRAWGDHDGVRLDDRDESLTIGKTYLLVVSDSDEPTHETWEEIVVSGNGLHRFDVTLDNLSDLNDSSMLSRKLMSSFHMSYRSKRDANITRDEWVSASYDGQGRIMHKEVDYEQSYDGMVALPDYSLDFTYDVDGRLTKVTGTEGYEGAYPSSVLWDITYGSDGRTVQAIGSEAGDRRHVDNVYDDGHLTRSDYLIREIEVLANGVLDFSYDEYGRITGQTANVGFFEDQTTMRRYETNVGYDEGSRIVEIEVLDSGDRLFSRHSYDYDDEGRLIHRYYLRSTDSDDFTANQSYTYDGAGHLKSADQQGDVSYGGTAHASFETDVDGSIVSARIEGEDYTTTYEIEYVTVETPRGQEPYNAVDLTDPFNPVLNNELWVSHSSSAPSPYGESEFLRENRRWLETHDSSEVDRGGINDAVDGSGVHATDASGPEMPDDLEMSLSNTDFDGKDCWVVFREGYRNGRIEASSFDVSSGVPTLVWDKSVTIADATLDGKVSQFRLTDDGEWEKIGEYDIPTDWALDILASNVEIVGADGTAFEPPLAY